MTEFLLACALAGGFLGSIQASVRWVLLASIVAALFGLELWMAGQAPATQAALAIAAAAITIQCAYMAGLGGRLWLISPPAAASRDAEQSANRPPYGRHPTGPVQATNEAAAQGGSPLPHGT